MNSELNYWRKCSTCKKEIGLGKIYQICEVTSCKKHVFCSVNCWNLHNEVMNHKSAGAIEMRAPFVNEEPNEASSTPRRILVNPNSGLQNQSGAKTSMDDEILIVASKLKQYVKEKYDLNTSANVMEALSTIVRKVTDKASLHAQSEGRKTLMDRDFE
jgi:histone H3/H4